eukprot:COSAG02_NODE_1584_length_11821_cov_11.601604_1_plen_353_part_00
MLSRQPSQQWRDDARRAQRDRAARAHQVGWRPETNLQRGDPRVRARDGTQAGPVLQAPNMPGFNNGPAARRSNVPIVCCGVLMERDSRQFKLVKLLVATDVLLITIYLLVAHDSSEDGLTLAGYVLGLTLTMCFAPLLIVSPFIVAAICKCWYNRKIEAAMRNSLMANSEQAEAEAEAARLDLIRAEMASTVMSGLRGDIEEPAINEPSEEPSGWMGHTIVQGEVLGDIILLDDASAAKPVSAMPVTPVHSASVELAANRTDGGDLHEQSVGDSFSASAAGRQGLGNIAALELADLPLGHTTSRGSPAARDSPTRFSPTLGSRESPRAVVGSAMIATGRVVQPGDWRLSTPR